MGSRHLQFGRVTPQNTTCRFTTSKSDLSVCREETQFLKGQTGWQLSTGPCQCPSSSCNWLCCDSPPVVAVLSHSWCHLLEMCDRTSTCLFLRPLEGSFIVTENMQQRKMFRASCFLFCSDSSDSMKPLHNRRDCCHQSAVFDVWRHPTSSLLDTCSSQRSLLAAQKHTCTLSSVWWGTAWTETEFCSDCGHALGCSSCRQERSALPLGLRWCEPANPVEDFPPRMKCCLRIYGRVRDATWMQMCRSYLRQYPVVSLSTNFRT